jgi:hypothetical protein
MPKLNIEDDPKKLKRLNALLVEYGQYLREREHQPLAAGVVVLVRGWVLDNENEVL